MLLISPSPRKGQSPPDVKLSARGASKYDSNLNLNIPKTRVSGPQVGGMLSRRSSAVNTKGNSEQRISEVKKQVTTSPVMQKNLLKKHLGKKIIYLKFLKKMGNSFYSNNKSMVMQAHSPDSRKKNASKSPDSNKNKKVVFVSLNVEFDQSIYSATSTCCAVT